MSEASVLANSSRRPFLAIVQDDVTANTLSKVVKANSWTEDSVLQGDIQGGFQQVRTVLTQIPTPRVLVLDISYYPDPLEDLMSLADLCDPECQVIILGNVNDINLYRTLIGMGVSDYLTMPLSLDTVTEAIEVARQGPAKPVSQQSAQTAGASRNGAIVSVLGIHGGVGSTALAMNLAWLLANEQKRKTALVDLDLYYGSTSLALDLEPGLGFREALEAPSRIDDLFLERAGVNATENLMILSAEEDLDRELRAQPSACDILFDRLGHTADYIVVDLPRTSRFVPGVLKRSEELILVADPTLASLRDVMRFKTYCASLVPEMRISLVLNRQGLHGKSEISKAEFAKETGLNIRAVVPFEPEVFLGCLSDGVPLSMGKGKSKALPELRQVAQDLAPSADGPVTQSFWQRLFSSDKADKAVQVGGA